VSSQPAPANPDSPTAADTTQPAAAPAPAPELGRLREYVLLEKIAQGGMGAVYRALHSRLEKIVALKTLPSERMCNPDAVARFAREMKAVGKLNHPNIVQATDAGEVGGTHFLVMEFVEGTDLATAVSRLGPLPIAAACEIARQAALALAHAHERGLIHRDVKPSNLLLSNAGQVKLLDLGLALLTNPSPDGGATVSGVVMGTFDYMAPEQAEDAHAVTERADVYSLGCTLYHLLAGSAPFANVPKGARKLRAHAEEPVPPLRAVRQEVPEALEAVLRRMLAKHPIDRFAGAAEAAAALAPFAAGADLPGLAATLAGSQDRAAAETFAPAMPTQRRRRSAALAAVVLLAVVAPLAGVLWLHFRPGHDGATNDTGKDQPQAELTLPQQRPVAPEDGFNTLLDADLKMYEAWLARMRTDGLRPVFVQARDAEGTARFQAIAVRDARPIPWEATHGLNEAKEEDRFNQLGHEGYQSLCRSAYPDGGEIRVASLWSKPAAVDEWFSFYGLTENRLTDRVAEMQKQGFRPASIQGYRDGVGTSFTVVFVRADGLNWEARTTLPASSLEDEMARRRPQGLRPISLGVHASGKGPVFDVVWLGDKPVPEWKLRRDLTAAEYRDEEESWTNRGYRPLSVVGYDHLGKTKYAAVWVGEPPLPRTGRIEPGLEPFDRAMTKFMRERSIPAGELAVVKDGRLLLSCGYGYADRERTKPLPADAPFRLASLTKMMTAAAIRKLIRDGKLTPETKVFDLLGLEPPPGKDLDPRWKTVTVGHLLDHQGGWDAKAAKFDPMFAAIEISTALGKPSPPNPANVIRYMLGQPLQFDPGTKTAYSNFGYCLLGRVIEKSSGTNYFAYLHGHILKPAGVTGMAKARTSPNLRDPREPFYSDPNRVRDVMWSDSKYKVPDPDGGFSIETMDSHGGLIASAVDVARFLTAYALDGYPAERKAPGGAAFGSLPGTFTMALKRSDGVVVVVLFNQRTDPSGLDYFPIEEVMNRAADAVKHWPAADAGP
jgi:CubicO group peptidase (beta-lactamase class C family)/tRNA A-37 threonylcarbamoyl transferase component Bud32